MTMPVGRTEMLSDALPSPFPEGWYFVTSRAALKKAKLLEKTWLGEKIVAFCDEHGNACVAEAFCPHLGSHLGPTTGGCVRQGRLVCPFHGFEYDTNGSCVATPYAAPPADMSLRVFPTHEIAGLIFAWWGIGGRTPQWHLPANPSAPAHVDELTPVDEAAHSANLREPDNNQDWSNLCIWTTRFPGHPQETTENAVDLAHLLYVHGYHSVSRVEKIAIDGHRFDSNFNFATTRKFAGVPFAKLDLTAHTEVHGLGYSFVRVREHSIGMDLRLWVLATPVDGTNIDLSIVSSVKEIKNPKRVVVGLGILPRRIRAPLMNRIVLFFQRHDVLQDVIIWSHKQARLKPLLSRSDGEIMAYRKYCSQFYSAEPT
ncbi:MAG: Rieske 2Fe-2S domain-containing protein [Acidimicrobiia bacterium]|nr:Rieske 2Fe-2S domain-containing protein [Acidimicrobiia bacterium]